MSPVTTTVYEKLSLDIFQGVYPPFEDSFLLASTIPKDLFGKKVLDLCTGSGLFGIIALQNGASDVTFADQNPIAVQCAKHNAEKNKPHWADSASFSNSPQKLIFVQGNLFDGLSNQKFDFIIVNPPYLPTDEALSKALIDQKPVGREILDLLLDQLGEHLSENGVCHLIQCKANGNDETLRRLQSLGLQGKILAIEKNFFVELAIFEIRR